MIPQQQPQEEMGTTSPPPERAIYRQQGTIQGLTGTLQRSNSMPKLGEDESEGDGSSNNYSIMDQSADSYFSTNTETTTAMMDQSSNSTASDMSSSDRKSRSPRRHRRGGRRRDGGAISKSTSPAPSSSRSRSKPRGGGRSKSRDGTGPSLEELNQVAFELERMASALGKVDDPQKILRKHITKPTKQ